MRVGDVVDDAHRIVAVAIERGQQVADRRQERERDVLGHSAVPAAAATGQSRSSAAKKCPISSSAVGGNSGLALPDDHDATRAELAGEPDGSIRSSRE